MKSLNKTIYNAQQQSLCLETQMTNAAAKESLTLSQTSPGFYMLQYKSFENTTGKGEIAH